MKNFVSEFFGTFIIIFFGLASVILFKTAADGVILIPLIFSSVTVLSFYLFSKYSFVTFNPMLSFTAYIRAFISMKEFIISLLGQIFGTFLALSILYLMFGKGVSFPIHSVAPELLMSTDLSDRDFILFSSFLSSLFLSFFFFIADFKKKYSYLYIGLLYFVLILLFYRLTFDVLNPLVVFITSIFNKKLFISNTAPYLAVVFFGTVIGGIFSFFFKKKLEGKAYAQQS